MPWSPLVSPSVRQLVLLLLTACASSLGAQDPAFVVTPVDVAPPPLLSQRQQGELRDRWLRERVETLLPGLMRRSGIDTWVLISREYNEDPVLRTLLPSDWMGARRTTMLIVHDDGPGTPLTTLACSRYAVGEVFAAAWDPDTQPDQWARLAEILGELAPERIGVNRSDHFGLADGLSSTHYEQLRAALPPALRERVVSAEALAIGWLETRLAAEMTVYPHIMRVAHAIIQEAFSERVIVPGVTTTEDVVWWLRQRCADRGLAVWFHPTVDVQRADDERFDHLRSFSKRPDLVVIQPGDLLHCDFGITYCGLNTDTQHNAYVLRPGETAPPPGLVAAHESGKRVMDQLTANFRNGRSGNDLLARTLADGRAAGLRPTVYTHPIGYHGHAAGPTIGLWDQQDGVPHTGDYPLHPNTAYSIELNNAVHLPAWGKDVRMMMEEDGYWDGERFRYIGGRQGELYLIPRQSD